MCVRWEEGERSVMNVEEDVEQVVEAIIRLSVVGLARGSRT